MHSDRRCDSKGVRESDGLTGSGSNNGQITITSVERRHVDYHSFTLLQLEGLLEFSIIGLHCHDVAVIGEQHWLLDQWVWST